MVRKKLREVLVFIASPSDVEEERKIIVKTLDEINRGYCKDHGYLLSAVLWENDTYQLIDGEHGQKQINDQLALDEFHTYDLFIGIMWKRFGTTTPVSGSGTREEFKLALRAYRQHGRPDIMFFFNVQPIPMMTDEESIDQLKSVIRFKKELSNKGLYREYNGTEEFAEIVRRNLILWFRNRIYKTGRTGEREKESLSLEIPGEYVRWLEIECRTMDIDRLITRGEAIQVGLPAVYIPLLTDDLRPERLQRLEKGRTETEVGGPKPDTEIEPEKERTIEIEELIAQEPYLLVEGAPGSGKTTMVKHLARSMVEETCSAGLRDFLPVLVYLKDLNEIIERSGDGSWKFERLEDYFRERENGLTWQLVEQYCKDGKIIFLLDGLDELKDGYRGDLVECFARLGGKYADTKVVVTTRLHAVSSAANPLGDKHRVIHALNMDQVEMFVTKWFDHLEGRFVTPRRKEMMKEIRGNSSVRRFTETPLMLTAVCILYMDEKKIPEQRADLYNRVINNLVWKRFRGSNRFGIRDMPVRVHDFLDTMALEMMKDHTKDVPRVGAERILGEVLSDEDRSNIDSIRDLFDLIEPNSGLLKLEKGNYSFYHLTYQEFLAARCLVRSKTQYWDEIRKYLDDPWFRETVLLFLGILSLENMSWTDLIIEELLKRNRKYAWRILGAQGLLDLPESLRKEKLLKKARERMLSLMRGKADVRVRLDAGEALGRLGDPRDLKEFIPIPAGEYPFQDETVELDAFEIGRYPVTNAWFGEFVEDGGYDPDREDIWTEKDGLHRWINERSEVEHPRYWHDREWNCPNSPVVGISWHEVKAFCNWLNAKESEYRYDLPTEKQWEAAARGEEGREYPWGDELNEGDDRCNYAPGGDPMIGRTSPVGMFPKGDTAHTDIGISDMAGNVWEWCKDELGRRVTRGGGWGSPADYCASASRSWGTPGFRYNDLGVRLARSS